MAARLVLATLFLALPLIQARSYKTEFKDVLVKCNGGKELSPELAEKFKTQAELTPEETQCILECSLKDFKMLEDGEFKMDAAKEVVSDFFPEGPARDIAVVALETCNAQISFKDQNQCETSVKMHNCIVKHMITMQNSFKARSKYVLLKCNSGNPVSADILKKMNTPLPVDTEEEKCLLGCVMKELGVLGDDGVNEETAEKAIKEFIPEGEMREKALQGIHTCKEGTKGQSQCEAGGHFHNCMTNVMSSGPTKLD